MSGGYGYGWPVPSESDVLEALAGVLGDAERGLYPKVEEVLIIFAHIYATRERGKT